MGWNYMIHIPDNKTYSQSIRTVQIIKIGNTPKSKSKEPTNFVTPHEFATGRKLRIRYVFYFRSIDIKVATERLRFMNNNTSHTACQKKVGKSFKIFEY